MARDICPFNSPIYKILVSYESKMLNTKFAKTHMHIGLSHNTDNDVLTHHYISKRNFESPTMLRKKLIDKAKVDEVRKS